MKILKITILFICFLHFFIRSSYSQEIHYYKSDTRIKSDNFLKVYMDYVSKWKVKNSIVLLDYSKEDSVETYRVTLSKFVAEIIYKKPDCYYMDTNNICYIFTKNYNQKKDTIWLENILQKTRFIVRFTTIKILWQNDSVMAISGFVMSSMFDPWIIEYKICNGKILSKTNCQKMLYPDISRPKGIQSFR